MNKAEILSIGDELLRGKTLNTNAHFLSEQLTQIGYEVVRETTLPDRHSAIVDEMQRALERSSLILCTGGLGPTLDDVTREAAAEVFGSKIAFRPEVADHLKKRYDMLGSLKNQSTQPLEAELLLGESGTAPGLLFHKGEKKLVLLPGVPHEMEELFLHHLLPQLPHFPLRKRGSLHLFETLEAEVDGLIRSLKEKYPAVDFGIYPDLGLLSLYLFSDDPRQLDESLKAIQNEFQTRIFSHSESDLLPILLQKMKEKKLTFSVAESCTGGAISSAMTTLPGASEVFLGGLVAYSNALKETQLSVSPSLLNAHGAVSPEVAKAMHQGALKHLGGDFAIAVTGIAGPTGGTPDKPVGTVWAAVGGKNPKIWNIRAKGSREAIIRRTVIAVYSELYRSFPK